MWRSVAGLVGFVLAGLAACNSSTGPTYPRLAGTYATTFNATATPLGYAAQPLTSDAGSITLGSPDHAGNFTGSYIEAGQAGTIAGTEHVDGGIDITQFGNPNETPLNALRFLQQQLPACDFAGSRHPGERHDQWCNPHPVRRPDPALRVERGRSERGAHDDPGGNGLRHPQLTPPADPAAWRGHGSQRPARPARQTGSLWNGSSMTRPTSLGAGCSRSPGGPARARVRRDSSL